MYCSNCGTQLSDNAKFCSKCGSPQYLNIQVRVSSEARCETCKIYYRKWKGSFLWSPKEWLGEFWAEGIGPSGKYLAGDSPTFYVKAKNSESIAHDFLVNQLVLDGWEVTSMPPGDRWWELMFRRIMRENNPKPWRTFCISYEIKLGKTNFILLRSPDNENTLSGVYVKDMTYMIHRRSSEFNGSFGFMASENEERREILRVFLQKLTSEGFEPVESSVNEKLKQAQIE